MVLAHVGSQVWSGHWMILAFADVMLCNTQFRVSIHDSQVVLGVANVHVDAVLL